jgi:hypothetical protein
MARSTRGRMEQGPVGDAAKQTFAGIVYTSLDIEAEHAGRALWGSLKPGVQAGLLPSSPPASPPASLRIPHTGTGAPL